MFNYTSNYNMHRKRKFPMKIKTLSAVFRVFIELPSYITVNYATKTAVQSDQYINCLISEQSNPLQPMAVLIVSVSS